MPSRHDASTTLKNYARLAVVHWRRWVVPAAAVTALATGYAAVRPDTWKAQQALVVRNEATGRENSPGKFRQPEEMKTVQETTLEVIRSRAVLDAALRHVGPPADAKRPGAWPSEEDVALLRENVKLAPPKGAEFGKTEVFYLEVRDGDRDRAIALSRAILTHLTERCQELRNAKAQSMIAELEKTVQVARADLTAATERLTAVESAVGGDLAELKAMGDVNSGDSALRRTATEIRSELREVGAASEAKAELLELLGEARHDAARLIALPNRLLDSQPALGRLKEGLVDAQLNTARLESRMSAEHPLVIAARQAENEVRQRLHAELEVAVRGLEVDLKLDRDRHRLLHEQLTEVTGRLDKLAALRASYTNDLAEANHRKTLLEHAEQNLADARAAQASANAGSLISPIDAPDAGFKPIGPSRATIALVGLLGGLLAGLGVLVFTLPVADSAAAARGDLPGLPYAAEFAPMATVRTRAGDKLAAATRA